MEYNLHARGLTISGLNLKLLEFKQWLGPDGEMWFLSRKIVTSNHATWYFLLPGGVIVIAARRGFSGVKLVVKDFAKGKAALLVGELTGLGFENITPPFAGDGTRPEKPPAPTSEAQLDVHFQWYSDPTIKFNK